MRAKHSGGPVWVNIANFLSRIYQSGPASTANGFIATAKTPMRLGPDIRALDRKRHTSQMRLTINLAKKFCLDRSRSGFVENRVRGPEALTYRGAPETGYAYELLSLQSE